MTLNPAATTFPEIWLKKIRPWITWETLIFSVIMLAVVVTRFYDLGVRVMSHDETQHTYFSWLFYKGNGYTHTPLTHGPLQFHLIALSYAMFGDNDFAARIPHAIASILSVLFLWNYRRYLGQVGTLIAAGLMLISPFMLYYGRYARNEALVVLFGLITIWAILRYLDTGQSRYLVLLSAASAFHFTAKETAFIYTAQAMLFLAILLIQRLSNRSWEKRRYLRPFLLAIIAGFLFLGIAFTVGVIDAALQETQTEHLPVFLIYVPEILGLISFALGAFFVIRGLGLVEIRRERTFHLLMLLGLLVLPQLAPLPVNYLGWDALDYSQQGMLRTATVLVPMALLTIGLGIWWNWRLFLITQAVFYGIFTIFYTTLFTYGAGFFTGLVGSLGYWLVQQGVERGSQPWYYYLVVQVPFYEYLPLLGALLAGGILLLRRLFPKQKEESLPTAAEEEILETNSLAQDTPGVVPVNHVPDSEQASPLHPFTYPQKAPVLALLGFWALTSLAAYTIAGEKMPWLTVHITLPLILLAGWGLGQLITGINWHAFRKQHGLLILILLPLFTRSMSSAFQLGAKVTAGAPLLPPEWLGFFGYVIFALITGGLLFNLLRNWHPAQFGRVALLAGFGFLAFLTTRAAWQAAFIRYDEATEFLVYAHSAPANKLLTEQIGELSERINSDLSLGVAYDNSDGQGDPGAAWPLTWYLRNFSNTRTFGPDIPRELLEYPVIFASDRNWDKVEPVLRNAYDEFQYIRMWWPIQDYFDLTWTRIQEAFLNPEKRRALFEIWLNRDYAEFARLSGKSLQLPDWQPSRSMRLYIRKDMSSQVWDRGSTQISLDLPEDPYAGGEINLQAEATFGNEGSEPGQFQNPRGIALAADNSLYIADTGNHRIQQLSPEGEVLHLWGTYSGGEASLAGTADPGTMNEPWDVAVGPDGSVYVADTWNSRVQKFSPTGEFLAAWGYFGEAETASALWGPRGIAVDAHGRVFVADTGNKRVVVFDTDGIPLSVIDPGLNEPVGVAVGPDGELYIADTWNQRVIVAVESAENIFTLESSWPIDGWFGQSLDNKPYISVSPDGRVFITDPEGFRVLEFSASGEFAQVWGQFGEGPGTFELPVGIAAGKDGMVWVSDSNANQIMRFQVPK